MTRKSDLLEKNIVRLNQGYLSKIKALVPSDVNSVLIYKVRCKLLAVFALQVWLEEYPLSISLEGVENLGQDRFGLLCFPFTTNLQLGNFKVCVILCENEEEDILDLPAIAVNLPALASHLYLFISLREEDSNARELDERTLVQANILGFVRHDQIQDRKLGIDYDEILQSYSLPFSSLEASFSALHTCVRYVNPDKIVVPSHLGYPVSGLVTGRTISEKIATIPSDTAWSVELFTEEELAYIFRDKNCRENLLKKQFLPKPTISKINLHKWFQEIINETENLLTPRQFVGDFMDSESNFAEEQIRQLIALNEIPEGKSKLQSEEIKIGLQTFQYITVAWPKCETQLDTGVNLCLLLIPLSDKYLPNGMSVTIQQIPFPDEVYKIPEYDLYYELLLELDLQSEIKIICTHKQLTYQQHFIYLED